MHLTKSAMPAGAKLIFIGTTPAHNTATAEVEDVTVVGEQPLHILRALGPSSPFSLRILLVCSFTDSDSGGHIAAINAAAKAVCRKSGVKFVDLHTPLIAACGAVPWADKGAAACKLCAPSCKRLSVHYIAAGYEFIARIVAKAAGLSISTQWKTDDQSSAGAVMGARSLDEAFRLIEEQGRQIGALQDLLLLRDVPAPPLPPPPPPAPAPGLFVVTAFGADPTGQRDSTAAIQQAFYSATAQMAGHGGPHSFSSGVAFEPEVRFPSGHYKINDTIQLSNVKPSDLGKKDCGALGNSTTWCYFALLRVTGEGLATVEQLDQGKDVFSGAVVERLTFSFMSLRGGRNQLFVGNNNTDQGFIKINDCSFEYANGAAIKIIGPVQHY